MYRTFRKEAAQEQSLHITVSTSNLTFYFHTSSQVSTYNFQFKVVVGAGRVHSGDDGLRLGGDEAEAEEVGLRVQGEAAHRKVIFDQTLMTKLH